MYVNLFKVEGPVGTLDVHSSNLLIICYEPCTDLVGFLGNISDPNRVYIVAKGHSGNYTVRWYCTL